jgi:hypothetical protein
MFGGFRLHSICVRLIRLHLICVGLIRVRSISLFSPFSRTCYGSAVLTRLFIAFAALAVFVGAQPRIDGRDFSGIWNYATMTPLERPQQFGDRETMTPEEADRYEKQTIARQATTNNTAGPDWWDPGTRHLTNRRTSLVIDPPNGRLPALTAEAQKRAADRARAVREHPSPEGPEALGLNVRCIQWAVAGPPMAPGVYNNDVQFIQTRDYVVILNEMIHDARLVPIDGRPHGTVRRWMGDSRGRWEGSTLVIDTINFSDEYSFRGSDEHLHLIERVTRLDADTLEYQFTVDDPTVWTAPWTGRFPMHRVKGPMYEYACHEGNFRSMEGILHGARVTDRDSR